MVASPAALAALIVRLFASGTPAAFDSVYPFDVGRAYVADAVHRHAERHGGLAKVISVSGDRAVLLLSGYAASGNSGAETLLGRAFSDFYEATRDASGDWTLSRRLPLDADNRMIAHRLGVVIVPGRELQVTDTVEVRIGGPSGFAARLNREARVSRVILDGHAASYEFAGGLLWLPAPVRERASLVVEYVLPMPHEPSAFLGFFLPNSGHARDQFLWHPVLNYSTSADHARFDVTVRVPREYYVSTSLEQTTRFDGDTRVVSGHSSYPTAGITLLYDNAWQPYELHVGRMRLEVFATPEFAPARAQVEQSFSRTMTLLSERFGEPHSDYFALVQRREAASSGWHFLSNVAVVAGRDGGKPSTPGPFPRAALGHELSHAWTHPTGPGALFLMEGWATLAESYLLADEYGPEVEQAFWESEAKQYDTGGYDGKVSILSDASDGGVAYAKGAWILRMMRDAVGDSAFQAGMRSYMSAPAGAPAGIADFTAAMSRASGRDIARWIAPWLEATTIPTVSARVNGEEVVLRQEGDGPLFDLHVDIAFVSQGVRTRRTVSLQERELAVRLAPGAVTSVEIDPDHRVLMHRQNK